MNVLIISNYFYPDIAIAAFRINAFAKYFHLAGHSVTVLTEGERDEVKTYNGCKIYYVKDLVATPSYMKKRLKKRHRKTLRWILAGLQRRLFLDSKMLWKIKALNTAKKLCSQQSYDVVLSSFGPLVAHLIAMQLRQSGFKFYWIADMRDEMSKRPSYPRGYAKRLERYEREIVNKADLVTSVSRPLLHDFRSLCSHNNFLEIQNGYDYDDVHDVNFQSCFTMSYIGNFYNHRWVRPDNWFKAFAELISEGLLPDNSIIKIVGNWADINVPDAIAANVVQMDEVPHKEAIRISIEESDVLVMIHTVGRKGVYSGKIFDYLATNKPILALCDASDVIAELIETTKSGFVVNEYDVKGIKDAILKCYSLWKNRAILPRDWDVIQQHRRCDQVKILLDYLSSHCNSVTRI